MFYTYIPHAFGRMKAPLLKLGDIQAKKDMLNVIGKKPGGFSIPLF